MVSQSVDWTPEEVSSDVNSYMTLLVKETVMLHKVLTRYLAQPIVEVCLIWRLSLFAL